MALGCKADRPPEHQARAQGLLPAQCRAQLAWALVRSVDDALGALADNGFTSRVHIPARRVQP